jgi:hypothetical protein
MGVMLLALFYIKAVLSSHLLDQITSTSTAKMDFNTTIVASEQTTVESQTFGWTGLGLQTAALAALIFAVCAYFPKLKARMQLAKLPVLQEVAGEKISRQTYLTSARALYSEGYQKARWPHTRRQFCH